MKRSILFLSLIAMIQLCAVEELLPLIRFDTSEIVRSVGWNAWAGEKKGQKEFDAAAKCIRLGYTKSEVTLNCPLLNEKLAQFAKQNRIGKVYVKYRIRSLEGKSQIQFFTDAMYVSNLGLRRTGEWETIAVAPGGWSKEGRPLEPDKLKKLHLVFSGSGELDIAEIGVVSEYSETPLKSEPVKPVAPPPAAGRAVLLDGAVTPDEYADAVTIDTLPVDADPQNPTRIHLKAGADGLYCAAVCRKSSAVPPRANHTGNSTNIWEDESVEFFFDFGKSDQRFQKVAVNANGAIGGIHNALDQSGIRAVAGRYGDRWEAELLIPWAFFETDADSVYLGFNAIRNCYDGGKPSRSGWTTAVWNECPKFGRVLLRPWASAPADPPEFFYAGEGRYTAVGNNPDVQLEALVFSPDAKSYTFRPVLASATGVVFPFQVPVTDSGRYKTVLLARRDGKVVSLGEYFVSESVIRDIEPLEVEEIALFPEPRFFSRGDRFIELADWKNFTLIGRKIETVGEEFAREMMEFYQLPFTESPGSDLVFGLANDPEMRPILAAHRLTERVRQIQFDGFAISVADGKIVVTANQPRGLLFGARALLDLIKMSTNHGKVRVCEATVVDWPRLERRFFHQMLNAYYHQNRYEPEHFTRMLARFPMRARFNAFSFELSDYYRWQSAELGIANGWTPQDYEAVVDMVNRNYMTVIPCVQSLGHMEWWLFNRPEKFRELREDGGNQVLCTGNPDSYTLLFQLFDEAIRLASRNPDYKPEHFYAGLDEVRWQTAAVPADQRCKRCAGLPKNKIFLDHIVRVNDYLKSKGLQMFMCSDMITEGHNGLNEFKCAEIAGAIPRDVIFIHWSTLDFPAIKPFAAAGHENWKLLTGYNDATEGDSQTMACGLAVYSYNWWLTQTRSESQSSYGPMAQALVMNNAWNTPQNWRAVVQRYGNQLMHNWSRKPIPRAGETVTPIALGAAANHPVQGEKSWFGEPGGDLSQMDFGTAQVAGVPTAFARKANQVFCVMADQNATVIPVGKPASSLILLHAADLPRAARKTYFTRENYSDRSDGPIVATYIVTYDDNSETVFTVNYGWNIADWQTGNRREEIFGRYLPDSRALWTGKTPETAARKADDDIVLYQFEWPNPKPDRPIKSITLKRDDAVIRYALLALSARSVR